jgi:ABC-type antimicrobial peptide transport system permease subunit
MDPNGAVYIPFGHRPFPRVFIALETTLDPLQLAGAAQKAIREVDSTQLITAAHPIGQLVQDATAQPRFRSITSTALSLVAFALVIGGVIALVSTALAEQRRASAIRLALGASTRRVAFPIVVRMGILTVTAIVVAAVLAVFAAQRAASIIPGSPQALPTTVAYTAAVHLLVVCAISYISARAAMKLDLVNELRQD